MLGEPWKTEGEDLEEHELFGRREPFSLDALPEDVLFLTAGVDCQDDRLEVVIMGHGRSEVFALDHRVFWGPIDGDAVWHDLDALLRQTWKHPNGGTIRIDAAHIDSGDGGHTEIVNSLTRPRYGRRVVAIKGKRTETLDATCYTWAARQLIGLNLDRRADELASPAAPKKAPSVIKSAWLTRQ